MGEDREAERAARVAVHALDGDGWRLLERLLERFGSAREAWAAGPAAWAPAGSRAAARREAWQGRWRRLDPEGLLAALRRQGVEPAMPGDPPYPPELAAAGGPPLLYARGDPAAARLPAVALVGTRRATPYGERTARRLAADLAAGGLAVVSGLARGVDAAAHEGALAAGGATVAVLGSGLGHLYPPEHVGLARRIAERGLLLSPYPPDCPPRRHLFPARNRWIARMALGVVVVEAGVRSGALVTAALALEAGRAVMAVPGRVDAWASAGCLALLRDGAAPVRHAEDVWDELERTAGPGVRARRAAAPGPPDTPPVNLTEEERRLYSVLLMEGQVEAEAVAARLGWPVQRVWAALTGLELKGVAARAGSGYVLPARPDP